MLPRRLPAFGSLVTCLAVAAVFALGLVGCAPPWTVIRQVVPNPMGPASPFYVQPVSLAGLRVGDKTEGEWMSTKSAETRDSWDGDKLAMNEMFAKGFDEGGEDLVRSTAPTKSFTIVAHFVRYEPGFYAAIVSAPGSIEAVIDIIDPNGTPLDQFTTVAAYNGMSQGQNARGCARIIGMNAARYIRARIGK